MRCDACPVRAALACVGERHPPVCRDVEAGMPGRAEQLVAISEGPRPGPPGLPAMARSFLVALARHLWDPRRASRRVREARLATCRACPEFDPAMPSCRRCGCGSVARGGLELKLSWATSACPDGRWPAV